MNLRLSDREAQVMELLIKGLSAEGIAKKLYMERSTIYGFIRCVFIKYGLKSNPDYDRKILAIKKYLKNKGVKSDL